jgi:lipoprotein signal peptidase
MPAAVLCLVIMVDQGAKALASTALPPVSGRAARPRLAWRLNRECTLARIGGPLALALWFVAGVGLAVVAPELPAWATIGGAAAWGGALSNAIDVLRRGAVVDFVMLWPRTRGNFADLALVLGAGTLFVGAAM